jgi:hypothetical protein
MAETRRLRRWVSLFVLVAAAEAGCGHGTKHHTADAGADVTMSDDATTSDDARGSPADTATAPDIARDATDDVAETSEVAPDGHDDLVTDRHDDAETVAPCVPVADEHFFVDPLDGRDDAAHTGAAGCPLGSLVAALAAIKTARGAPTDAGVPPATITIVNTKAAPTLMVAMTHNVGLDVPAGVTIAAEDPTRNTPIISTLSSLTTVQLEGTSWRLSHVNVACNSSNIRIGIVGGGGTVDHVTIEGCYVGLGSGVGQLIVGPGVTLRGNQYGLEASDAIILGGAGVDHTSISDNQIYGIRLFGSPTQTTVDLRGRDIPPGTPDQNDITIDGNDVGIFADPGTTLNVRGLHATGNLTGILSSGSLKVRGSFLADNARSAISVSVQAGATVDLGQPGDQDPGRNVLAVANQSSAVNAQGALCASGQTNAAPILAAGNIFGSTDCVTGGALTTAATCTQQADVAGAPLGAIDVSGCTTP